MADVVVINAPALVSLEPGHPEVHASLRAAADRRSCRPEGVACILVSHIPLWRESGSGCTGGPDGAGADWRLRGGGNQELRQGSGYSYLNMLPKSLSHQVQLHVCLCVFVCHRRPVNMSACVSVFEHRYASVRDLEGEMSR